MQSWRCLSSSKTSCELWWCYWTRLSRPWWRRDLPSEMMVVLDQALKSSQFTSRFLTAMATFTIQLVKETSLIISLWVKLCMRLRFGLQQCDLWLLERNQFSIAEFLICTIDSTLHLHCRIQLRSQISYFHIFYSTFLGFECTRWIFVLGWLVERRLWWPNQEKKVGSWLERNCNSQRWLECNRYLEQTNSCPFWF